MTRKKRTSRVLENAELRAAGVKAADPEMDMGDGRSVANFTSLIDQVRAKIEAYNMDLAALDSTKTEIRELEKNLAELSDQMLIAIAFKYGKDSRQYEMAGGVRKSERIRRSTVSRLKARGDEALEIKEG